MQVIKPRAIIYIRVSDPSQIENNSLETQEKECRRYATNKEYDVVDPIFRDEGISAKNFEKRPGVSELLKFATLKKNNIQKVIVYKMDRWTRNVEEGLMAISLLAKCGISLESATEVTDETSVGKAIRTILMAVGELDNGLKSERVKDNLLTMFKNGYWCWKPPIGYIRPSGGKDDRRGKECIIDKNLGEIVRIMFLEGAKGTKRKVEIANIANNLGFQKFFNKPADCNLVSKIIKKTFYFGYMYAPKWKIYSWGKHVPIIDEETWQRANINLFNKKHVYHMQDESFYPLKGLLKCNTCGKHFTSSNPRGKFRYYECKNKLCSKQERILVDLAHKQFIEFLREIKPNEAVVKLFSNMIFNQWDRSIDDQKQKIEIYDKRIAEQENLITGALEANRKMIISDDETRERVEKSRLEIATLKLERGDIKIDRYDAEITRNFVESFIFNLDNLWIRLNLPKRMLLQSHIFPNGLVCQNKIIRTNGLSPSFELISKLNTQNSSWVTLRGIEPRLAE